MKKTILITATLLFIGFTTAQAYTQIEMELKETEPTPLQTSEKADVWLEVTNEGNTEAENIGIEFNENYPFTVERGDKKQWSITKLVPGDTYQIHLNTRVDDNAVQGNNTLNFDVNTPGLTIEEKVPVEVRSDRNVISVKSIDFPEKVAPGSTEEMSITLSNPTSGQLKNIQFSLDTESDDLPFATDEASRKNLASISPGESEEVSYTLSFDENAENSVYKLPLDVSFENEAGTGFEQSMTTGVNIGGTPELQADLNTEKTLTAGSTEELTFRLVNTGHGSAEFVSMKLNETQNIEVLGSNKVYIGSMDSDDYQTASFKVNIKSETEKSSVNMPVILEYKDAEGSQVQTENIQAELYTSEELKKLGVNSGGSPAPLIILVLLVVVGGAYYWRRKRD